MKIILSIIILFTLVFASCRKQTVIEYRPDSNVNDPNYDEHNNIFRLKASATAPFKVYLSEYANDGILYNNQIADQTGPFDYGFTPIIGHKISISIQSQQGIISTTVMYKGVYLAPVIVKSAGAGTIATFEYAVKD